MGTITVRNIDDDLLARTTEAARLNNRSLSAEVREMMAESDRKRRVTRLREEMREFLERNPLKLPDGVTSLDLLREERDSW
jgi:plasmid stability protein